MGMDEPCSLHHISKGDVPRFLKHVIIVRQIIEPERVSEAKENEHNAQCDEKDKIITFLILPENHVRARHD